MLFATAALLGVLGDDHGTGALVGYSALATAVALALALVLQQATGPVAAGVLADARRRLLRRLRRLAGGRGSASSTTTPTGDGLAASALLVLELLTIAAALRGAAALPGAAARAPDRRRRFAVAARSTSAPEEYMAILAGLVLVAVGHAVDRAGRAPVRRCGCTSSAARRSAAACSRSSTATRAGSSSGCSRSRTSRLPTPFGRSSYAVLGAIGILATTTYFIEDGLSFVGFFVPFGSASPRAAIRPVADRALLRRRRAS